MSSSKNYDISQLNLSMNINNHKNIKNIQIILDDFKEQINILSFRISDISVLLEEFNEELNVLKYNNLDMIYDSNVGNVDKVTSVVGYYY